MIHLTHAKMTTAVARKQSRSRINVAGHGAASSRHAPDLQEA